MRRRLLIDPGPFTKKVIDEVKRVCYDSRFLHPPSVRYIPQDEYDTLASENWDSDGRQPQVIIIMGVTIKPHQVIR